MKFRLIISVLLNFLVLVFSASTEPTIRQIFPKQTIFLGDFVDWTIEVRHPLWESYELKLMSPRGAEMKIVDTNQQSIGNEMRSVYRIRIIPNSLTVEGTPSIMISDGRGRNSVLNGKPVRIETISGDSTQIQEAGSPVFRKTPKPIPLWIPLTMITLLLGLLFYVRFRRRRAGTPRAQLLRQLRRLRQELQNGEVRNPLLLSRLLRSDLIWGLPAESLTAAELREKSSGSLQTVSTALESLDLARYAPGAEKVPAKTIEDAVDAAIQIVNVKRPEQMSGGRAA